MQPTRTVKARGVWRPWCAFLIALCAYPALAPPVYGQEASSAPVPEPEPQGWRRFSFGGRLNGLPFNVLSNKDENLTPANATASYAFHTSNTYLQIAFGPSLEFRVTRAFTLSGEFLYHRLNYTKTDTITADGNVTTVSEQTRATLWDVPVMLRWRGVSDSGFLSKLYFAGGSEVRNASHIATSNQTTFPDGTMTSNNTATVPSKRNLAGAVAGVGLRFVDDFGIKLTPELRYTRWMGATFASDSTRSRRDELVIGIALTF